MTTLVFPAARHNNITSMFRSTALRKPLRKQLAAHSGGQVDTV